MRREEYTTNHADTFLKFILGLKTIKRTGWLHKAKILKSESVADHSYSLCAMAMILSDIFGFDTEKVMKMCVIHDLSESVIGDYMPDQISRTQKKLRENEAMKYILSYLPQQLYLRYINIWKEYLLNKSKEARFVRQLDKVEMFIQANYYIDQGYPYRYLAQFFQPSDKHVKQKNNDEYLQIVRMLKTFKIPK